MQEPRKIERFRSALRMPVGRLAAFAVTLTAALLVSGCGMTEKRTGVFKRRVTATRVETVRAPVPNWPVWVFVDGRQVGAFRTGPNGELPFDLRPYIAQGQLNVEFRFQQPDGKVERQFARYPR